MGFRATLNFRKFKVALNPMYRIFLNFTKSCVLSCLLNVDNIKKFHRAVFELYVTKMVTTCLPMVGQFFDTMIVASSDKEWS